MKFKLPGVRIPLIQRVELVRIVQHPAGERFDRVLADQLRGAPELIEHLATQPEPKRRTSAERVAEHRARKRAAKASPTLKEK
jgi:hypothetical protein